MTDEKFQIRAYLKAELAETYFPRLSTEAAMKKFRTWLDINPRLRHIRRQTGYYYTPKQVKAIVRELGEPFDTE